MDASDSPRGIAFADLDGDGRNDIVVANNGSDTLSLFVQRADGTFRFDRKLAAGREPIEVCAIDVNRDSRPDLLSTNFSSGELSLYIATGGGAYNAAVQVRLSPTAISYGLACGDLDGDGTGDAVVTSFNEERAYTLRFNSAASTSPSITGFATGRTPIKVTLRDFDRDGLLDVFVVNRDSDSASIFRNIGGGQLTLFQTVVAAALPFGAEAFSIGTTEYLAVATAIGQTVDLYSRLPGGTYGSLVRLPTGQSSTRSVIAIDRDFDGDLDLVAVNAADSSVSSFTYSAGTFGPAVNTPSPGGLPRLIEKFDINADGRTDYAIVSANSLITLYLSEVGG